MNEKGEKEKIPERMIECLRLRQAGKSYREIGPELGISFTTAYNDVKRALEELREHCREEAILVRDIQVTRIDSMIDAIWQDALGGNLLAVDRVVKLEDQRARLIGTFAPAKQEIEHNVPEPIRYVPAPERVDE